MLPGSHFLYAPGGMTQHYGRLRGSVYATSPAGSVFITDYSIWHRRSESWGSGLRNNVKMGVVATTTAPFLTLIFYMVYYLKYVILLVS